MIESKGIGTAARQCFWKFSSGRRFEGDNLSKIFVFST
jgi:hypothetical protein